MAHPLKAISNVKIQMPNEYQMPKCQMTLALILSFGFHLNFVN
jgi:hypothetical protein